MVLVPPPWWAFFSLGGHLVNYFPDQVFLGLQEIAGEITLIIPLAGCSHRCVNCHSPHFQDKNGGEILVTTIFDDILHKYENKASCVCFFGGEWQSESLCCLSDIARMRGFRVALYSGFDFEELPEGLADCFDYIKCGEYREELGGLDSRTTNQRMLRRGADGSWTNITEEYWR